MRRLPLSVVLLLSASLTGAVVEACSATGSTGAVFDTTSTGSGNGSGAGAGSASSGTGGDGGGLFDSGTHDVIDPDASCGLITVQGKVTPLDLYIAMDKSSSQFGDKWDGAVL